MGIDLIKNKKVEIFDRNIRKRFGIIVSGIGVVLPIVLIFVSIPEKYKILTGLIFVVQRFIMMIFFDFLKIQNPRFAFVSRRGFCDR